MPPGLLRPVQSFCLALFTVFHFFFTRHQTFFLVDLAFGQGVFLVGVGVVAALEFDADRRADQLEYAPVGVFQVAHISLGHMVGLVAVNNDQRRVGTAQVGIAQLDATAIDHRRLVLLHGGQQDVGQLAGRPAGDGRGKGLLYRAIQVTDAGAVQGGNKVDIGKVDEIQPAFQLGLDVIAFGRLHAVPLVDRHHQRLAGLQRKAEQAEVVFDNAFAGIDHKDHHVGILDGLQGFHHLEFFYVFVDTAATTNDSGINQGVFALFALKGNIDAVAGGAGLVVDHHPFFTENAVDQRRLAHIGAANDGNLDAVLFAGARDAHRLFAFG